MSLSGATDVGGTESGSTDGARGKKNKPPVEESRSRKDISVRHELFSETSLFPYSVAFLHPHLVPFLASPTEEHCHCGTGAKGKSVSLPLSPLWLPIPLFLSDFQYLSPVFSSAASSKCLQITLLWNSTLHLYLCLLGQYASCGLWFCSVAD